MTAIFQNVRSQIGNVRPGGLLGEHVCDKVIRGQMKSAYSRHTAFSSKKWAEEKGMLSVLNCSLSTVIAEGVLGVIESMQPRLELLYETMGPSAIWSTIPAYLPLGYSGISNNAIRSAPGLPFGGQEV
ncbi:hypothetical protein ACLKA6_002332 [Drosophila palustris]